MLSAGVDMVKNSVDAAFGRIDTMEQFNRVMNVMTHDTGITNKALADTNQIVKGTAYGLNVASKAVQSFVSRGMEVKKSTDTVEAFADAVSFFGDGTNATLESVMSALGKMQTKGNVTMEHLEMLFNAGIPAVEIYANAVGMSTEEVTAAISKGTLRTDDFISTMNQAFKTGVEGFPSIAGAAKEAGVSWTGTFDNMRAAITRGTQAIITSVDNALESVGKPSTREMIANFGKTFESTLKGIAAVAVPVVQNIDALENAVVAVSIAFAANKVIHLWKSAVKDVADVTDRARENGSEYNIVLSKGSAAKTADAAATAKQTAEEKKKLAEYEKARAARAEETAQISKIKAEKAAEALSTAKLRAEQKALAAESAKAKAAKAAEAAETARAKAAKLQEKAATADQTKAEKANTDAVRANEKAVLQQNRATLLQNKAEIAAVQAKTADNKVTEKAVIAEKLSVAAKDKSTKATVAATVAEKAEKAATEADTIANQQNVVSLTLGQAAVAAMTHKLTLKQAVTLAAASAQKKLNAAISANPLGVAIGLTTALIAVTKTLNEKYNESYKQAKQLAEETEELCNKNAELIKSLKDSESEHAATIQSAESNAAAQSRLTDKIYALQEAIAKGKIADENIAAAKRQLSANVEELNSRVKDLNLSYNAENNALSQNKRAATEAIAAQKDLIRAKAELAQQSKIMDSIIEAENQRFSIKQQLEELEKAYEPFKQKMRDSWKNTTAENFQLGFLSGAGELEKKIADLKAQDAELAEQIDIGNKLFDQRADSVVASSEAIIEASEKTEAGLEQQNQAAEEWAKKAEEAAQRWQESFESHQEAVVNSFKEIPSKFEMSAEEMTETLNSNAEKYAEWQRHLSALSVKLSAEAIAELEKLGPAGDSVAKELLENADRAAEFEAAIQKSIDVAGNAANQDMREAGLKSASAMGAGIAESSAVPDALQDQIKIAGEQAQATVKAVAESIDSSGIESSMSDSVQRGADSVLTILKDMGDKIDKRWEEIKRRTVQTVTLMLTDVNIRMFSGGYNSTKQLINGALKGFDDNEQRLYARADAMINNVINIMNRGFDINSPSKKIEKMFRYVIMGGVKGFDDNEDELYSRADKISDEILDRLDPDPDSLRSFVAQMRDIVSYTPWDSARLSSPLTPALAGAGTQYTSNFTQVINSPKALSASEMSQEALDAQRRAAWQIP